MNGVTGLVVLLAGALGVAVGLAAAIAFRLSERQQHHAPPTVAPVLDDGIVRVLSVLRSAAVVVDTAGGVVRASAPAHALGLVRDATLTHPAVRDLVAEVVRTGEIRDEELELPRGPLGSGMILVQVRVAPIDATHLVVLAEDLTQARRLEAIRRDFVVNISHELKTPVGALTLLAETVQDAADDAEAVRRFAGRMVQEAGRLSSLVHEIIELSRLQVADALEAPAVVAVDDVIAEALDRARTKASARKIRIVTGGTRGLTVIGDHALLVTAVRNLLDNAVSYSPEATRVGIGVRAVGGLVEIAVVDQGIGIGQVDIDRIFERFYRVDPARSRDTGGTGLGLSIVKHVAADHGGEVTVWSQQGKGSTFTLRLPAARVADTPPATHTPSSAAPAATSGDAASSDRLPDTTHQGVRS